MSETPDRDEFAALLQRTLEGAGELRPIRYDQARFALRIGDEGELCFNLENVYAEYCQADAVQRDELLLRVPGFVPYQPQIPDDFAQVRDLLLPRVRERIFYELHRLRLEVDGESGVEFPHRVVADDLACGLCVDLPESVVEFGRERFALWGVDFDAALEVALANLRARSEEPLDQVAPGLWISTWRDSHDASRLLLTDLIGDLPVAGQPVCMVPNRDVLLVSGSADPEGLRALAAVAQQILAEPRPLSSVPLLLTDDGYRTFDPPPELGAQVANLLAELTALARARDYAEQRQLLQSLHAQRGDDLQIGDLTIARLADGSVTSYCAWSEGVEALLPRAERLILVRDGQPLGQVDWDVAALRWGELFELRDGVYPPRYRVRGFPEPAQLEGLEPFTPPSEAPATVSDAEVEALRARALDDPEAAGALAMLTARLAAQAAQAGDAARGAALFDESAELFEGRLAAGDIEVRPRLAEVLVQRGTLLRALGRSDDAAEVLERADMILGDLVAGGQDDLIDRLARARLSRARLHYDLDALPQALTLVQQAVEGASTGWRVEAGMLEADLLRLRCRFAEARRVLDATFVTAQALGDERALIEVLLTLLRGSVAHDQGHDAEALNHLADAEARLGDAGQPQLLAKIPLLRALTLLDARVDLPGALEAFGVALARLEALAEQGAPVAEEVCEARLHRGRCLIRAQQAEAGLAELDAVTPTLDQLIAAGSRDAALLKAQATRDRALGLLVQGDPTQAEAHCRQALDLFEARIDLGAGAEVESYCAQTRARLATALLQQEKLEPARYAFRGAINVYSKLVEAGRGLDVKDLARAHVAYADTLRRLGEPDAARDHALKVPLLLASAEGPAVEPILNAASSLLTIIR